MMNKTFAAAALAVACAVAPAQAATTLAWSFSGTYQGSGTLTYDEATDQLTAFTGKYNGRELSLVNRFGDPNNPGAEISYDPSSMLTTYRGVPNTGGANYTVDNKAHQTPDTQNFLVSTGQGGNEIVYALGYDGPNFFFFNIETQPSYRYVQDNGTFTTSAVAAAPVPEPASWALLMLGFGGIGYAMRRRAKVSARIRFA